MCDTVCVRTGCGMLFAKSSDRPIDEPQVVRWFGRRPAGVPSAAVRTTYLTLPDAEAAALLGSQPTWMWGLEHGVNEHRVAIGNEKVWTVDDPRRVPPALLGMDLVRLGLERATSADTAVDVITSLLEAHGQGGSGESDADEPYWSSFLVVDGTEGWVVETSGRTWVAAPVGPGRSISNRLTLSSDWVRSSPDVPAGSDWDQRRAPDAPTGIADGRLSATRRWVALGSSATPGGAAGMLRDHGPGPWGAVGATEGDVVPPPGDIRDDWSGVTVCMHLRDYQCTTASMIVDLPADPDGAVRAWASLGTPCSGVFLPVAMLSADAAIVPEILGDVAAWRSFSRLSRAVEAPGDAGAEALAAVRAALGPLEAAAWALADELWASRADARRWASAAAEWDADVRCALAELDETAVRLGSR